MRAVSRGPATPLSGLLALCVSSAALLLTLSPAPPAAAATCPNEAIRAEQGAAALALPDCRAYELVSPGSIVSLSKTSVLESGGGKASPDGNALSYFSRYPAQGSNASSETWLSNRTASGWVVSGLDPQMTPSPTLNACDPGIALSENLGSFVFSAGGNLESVEVEASGECGVPVEELVPGEPRGYANLYLRRGGGPFELVNPVPAGVSPANATFQAASPDLTHIVFNEKAKLTSGSVSGSDLFEWSDGTVREIGILPDGEHVSANLAAGSDNWGESSASPLPGYGLAPVSHAVSADGERVFFEANGNLYLRENAGQAPAAEGSCLTTGEPGLACTLEVDRSLGAGADGGGVFQFASRDGGRVFFTSDHALTFPASVQAGKPDLYEYDVGANKLTDLTAVGQSEAANVRGFSGGADDGSQIYFVARGVLTGSQQNGEGEVAQPGQPNLYLARGGELTYLATLSTWEAIPVGGKDQGDWWEMPGFASLKTAWSPSGRYLLFSSRRSLTGFDNAPAEPGLCGGENCEELFLYDAETEALSCVSCDSGGEQPVAGTSVFERIEFQRLGPPGPRYLPRAVLDDGEVFFETKNSLLPQDVNRFQDVYEYLSGVTSLISSGTGIGGSGFVDASADGRNVFFVTSEPLVRADGDGLPSVYDARVGGGFIEPPPPAACVSEESCRAAGPAPPSVAPPATTAVSGPGNVRPQSCKRGYVRRGRRCVKQSGHHHGKSHHRNHRAPGRSGRGH